MKSTQKHALAALAGALACGLSATAQTITLTPAVGYTSGYQTNTNTDKEQADGATAGLTLRIGVKNRERMQFLTGLEYVQKPAVYAGKQIISTPNGLGGMTTTTLDVRYQERYSYIQVPIAVQYRVFSWNQGRWSVYALGGVSMGYGLERTRYEASDDEINTSRKKLGKIDGLSRYDLAALTGYKIARRCGPGALTYEMRYVYSFTAIEDRRRSRMASTQIGYVFDWPAIWRKNPAR
jgi:hypothetical protein